MPRTGEKNFSVNREKPEKSDNREKRRKTRQNQKKTGEKLNFFTSVHFCIIRRFTYFLFIS